MYDIIIENNATRKVTVMKGENVSTSHLYLQFDDIELPVEDGEYTVVCIINNRDDVEYEFTEPILESLVKTSDGDVKLKYLDPIVNIMRVGEVTQKNKYDDKKVIFYEG